MFWVPQRDNTHNLNVPYLPIMASTTRIVLLDESCLIRGQERRALPPTLPGWLLARLAVQGTWMAREELAVLLWPDAAADEGQHKLRVHLHRLREWLGDAGWTAGLQAERARIRFDLPCDVVEFRAAIGRGDVATAVALHRRPLLAGWRLKGFETLEEWLDLERRELLAAWSGCARRHAQALIQAGANAAAEATLAAILEADPLAEDVLQDLLRLSSRCGSTAGLPRFEAFVHRLRDELASEPMPQTLALAAAVRERRAAQPEAAAATVLPRALVERAPWVGRDALLAQVRHTPATVILVDGEPGIGKTRLLQEAWPDAVALRCRDALTELPFHPLLDVLRERRKEIVAQLPQGRLELARLVPEFARTAPPLADAQLAKPRLFDALARAMSVLSETICVDDLQWADALTLEWLAFVAMRGAPRLVLAQRRGEGGEHSLHLLDGLERDGLLARVTVPPLDDDAIGALLTGLGGATVAPPHFTSWLLASSGGNPYFALEILRALFDAGQLTSRDGSWTSVLDGITQDYGELRVPPGVASLVRQRAARLPEAARRVLDAAAVADGAHLPTDRLANACGLSIDATVDAWARLEAAGLLAGDRLAHDLVRQAIYQALPARRRERLHERVAESLAALPASARVDPAVLMRHWRAGNRPREAWHAAFAAAQALRERGGLDESARAYAEIAAGADDPILRLKARAAATEHLLLSDLVAERQALEAILTESESLPDGPAAAELRARVRTALADNAVYDGDLSAAQAHIDALRPLLSAIDRAERQHALEIVIEVAQRRGDFAAAHAALAQARAEQPDNPTMLVCEGMLAWNEMRIDDAIGIYRRVVAEHPDHCHYIMVENDCAVALLARGAVDEAEQWVRRGLATWAGIAHAECLSLLNLGAILTSAARWDEAAGALERTLPLAHANASRLFEGEALHRIGRLHLLCGRVAAATDALRAAVACLPEGADDLRLATWHAQSVPACLAAGDEAGAAHHLEDAMRLAGGRPPHPLLTARIARAAAQWALARRDATGAAEAAERMIAAARPIGLDEFLAEGLLLRGRAYECVARPNAALACADEALSIVQARGLPWLRERALAMRARCGIRAAADAPMPAAPTAQSAAEADVAAQLEPIATDG